MIIQREAQDGCNWEYLCTLLKDLLTIPHDNLVGRMMWRLITRTANRVVTANMKEDIETLSNADLLDLIGKKQILRSLMRFEMKNPKKNSSDRGFVSFKIRLILLLYLISLQESVERITIKLKLLVI